MKPAANQPAPGSLEGVQPRHAMCLKCGYVPGGVPIKGGVVVCPECGHASEFHLPPPDYGWWTRLWTRSVLRLITMLLIAGLIAFALVFSRP